ncbi:MAG: tRNA glutamyl-Q(34) synthetase GluQRS [Acidobacteriaceae bacterium]
MSYRGRIAPTPTGYLHSGHARTFSIAAQRARAQQGVLILRNEDLDPDRCKPQYIHAMFEDLRWLGFQWSEGPDVGGPHSPYNQSQRRPFYLDAWHTLVASGHVYPCTCSRKDLQQAAQAPHESPNPADPQITDEELLYPGTCRPAPDARPIHPPESPAGLNWRFRVPDSEAIHFTDAHYGPKTFLAGRDFSDFLIWRRDNVPAYQLAVVVDDHLMRITEVVRGQDLLVSTARQILLYRALGWTPPDWYHCPLVTDAQGRRLAKRHHALSIRTLRQQGQTPQQVLGLE